MDEGLAGMKMPNDRLAGFDFARQNARIAVEKSGTKR
jgi:hypothetical protein